MRKELEKTILYNMIENSVLNMLDELEFDVKNNDIEDKVEPRDEDISNDMLLVFKYSLSKKRYLEIIVESERIIFLQLDEDDCEISEYVLDNHDGELNELIYN